MSSRCIICFQATNTTGRALPPSVLYPAGGDGASTSDGRAEEATKAAAEAGAAAAAQVRIGTEAAAAAAATAAAEADGGDPEAAAAAAIAAARAKKVDAAYFDSYSYFDIHRDMLGDKVGFPAGYLLMSCELPSHSTWRASAPPCRTTNVRPHTDTILFPA